MALGGSGAAAAEAAISTSTGTSIMLGATMGGVGGGAKIGCGAIFTGLGGAAAVKGERVSQTPRITPKATRAAAVITRLNTSKRVMVISIRIGHQCRSLMSWTMPLMNRRAALKRRIKALPRQPPTAMPVRRGREGDQFRGGEGASSVVAR